MGCASSSPAKEPAAASFARRASREPETPDVGLSDAYDAVKFLGRGGTGDTWLFRCECGGRGGLGEGRG